MKYITSASDNIYSEWQVEVMLTNFQKVGIDLSHCHIVLLNHQGRVSDGARRLERKFPLAHFHFFSYSMKCTLYLPSMKPYGMWKLFEKYPELERETIFYHDSDMIFLDTPDFSVLENHDRTFFMSDTISYIGFEYLLKYGLNQIKSMASAVGIPIEIIIKNQNNSGGAQYVIKGVNAQFWKKVFEDSFYLYAIMNKRNTGVQKWCAEMWATLWNAWYFDFETKVVGDLDFVRSTDLKTAIKHHVILHNNGVTGPGKLFYKGAYTRRKPYGDHLNIDTAYCSAFYWNAVCAVKN